MAAPVVIVRRGRRPVMSSTGVAAARVRKQFLESDPDAAAVVESVLDSVPETQVVRHSPATAGRLR